MPVNATANWENMPSAPTGALRTRAGSRLFGTAAFGRTQTGLIRGALCNKAALPQHILSCG